MSIMRTTSRGLTRLFLAVALGLFAATAAAAAPAERITLLVPSAINVPAFIPLVLAKHLGFFTDAGYDVTFVSGKGGVDVAKQVGVGNAEIGCAIGDTPILVRGNGVPVKVVALLGSGAMTTIVGRRDHGIETIEDLRGKKVSVLSFQDTTYYALLGALASAGIPRKDVGIESVGPGFVTNMVLTGSVDACACVPEREVEIRDKLGAVTSIETARYVPSMAQAVIASDTTIATRPDLVRGVVAAILRAIRFVIEDPKRATQAYVAAVPGFQGREDYIEKVIARYVSQVYGAPDTLGMMDAKRLQALEDVYLREHIISTAVPVEQLFTNAFVPH